jgi:hypothetical protein
MFAEWNSRDGSKAVKAVNAVTRRETLIFIAVNARNWKARRAAINLLEGDDLQEMFVNIVLNDLDSDVKLAALDKLDPKCYQAFFVKIAMASRSSVLRHAAIKKITDVEKLIELIQSYGNSLLSGQFITRYEYSELLRFIYKKRPDEAIHKVIQAYDDMPLNKDIFISGPNARLCMIRPLQVSNRPEILKFIKEKHPDFLSDPENNIDPSIKKLEHVTLSEE